ncbi:MAG: hypothetical protein K0U98_01675 [Deltaproteobacteria bacterium]|nr:hypothetical protein [Deltaproteobacteria bacterium]
MAGALYDLIFAGVMVVAPQMPAKLLNLPMPGETFYLWLMAIFLVMLASLYLAAAINPRRYSAIIAVAIVGRIAGAVAFAVAARGRPELSGLYLLATADLAFGLAHLALWLPVRR